IFLTGVSSAWGWGPSPSWVGGRPSHGLWLSLPTVARRHAIAPARKIEKSKIRIAETPAAAGCLAARGARARGLWPDRPAIAHGSRVVGCLVLPPFPRAFLQQQPASA